MTLVMDHISSDQGDQNYYYNNDTTSTRIRQPQQQAQSQSLVYPRASSSSTSNNMPPPSTIPSNRRRKSGPQPIAPAPTPATTSLKNLIGQMQQSSPSASVSSLSIDQDQDDDEYVPKLHTSGTSKKTSPSEKTITNGGKRKQPPTNQSNGGKPNKMSREALRKANHSLIERRRREKINAALGELRIMVPGLGEDGGKAGEFKLEVLERTVSHMKDLKNHIKHLESIIAEHGVEVPSMDDETPKREDGDNDEDGHHDGEDHSMTNDHTQSFVNALGRMDNTNQIPSSDINYHQAPTSTHQFNTHSRSNSNQFSRTHSQISSQAHNKPHSLSPYPSPRPEVETLNEYDPNETEPETNLPPPLAKASRIHRHQLENSRPISRPSSPPMTTPSVASLLAQVNHSNSPTPPPPIQPISRPAPPPQSNNPNPIFLPFPAPSPTSPFMNPSSNTQSYSSSNTNPYSSSSSSNFNAGNSFTSDPSPFLAPIGGMTLFGGVLNLDQPNLPSPADSLRTYNHNSGSTNGKHSPPSLTLPPSNTKEKLKDMPPEEAANLLLAFSSPDVMRPQTQVNINQNGNGGSRERRLTLDNDDFKLDSSTPYIANNDGSEYDNQSNTRYGRNDRNSGGREMRGISAMDILKMSDSQR